MSKSKRFGYIKKKTKSKFRRWIEVYFEHRKTTTMTTETTPLIVRLFLFFFFFFVCVAEHYHVYFVRKLNGSWLEDLL